VTLSATSPARASKAGSAETVLGRAGRFDGDDGRPGSVVCCKPAMNACPGGAIISSSGNPDGRQTRSRARERYGRELWAGRAPPGRAICGAAPRPEEQAGHRTTAEMHGYFGCDNAAVGFAMLCCPAPASCLLFSSSFSVYALVREVIRHTKIRHPS
jgi:hypothetical protein